ncbi:hypothetical protein [Tsuneonella sp. HG222]
MIKRCFDADRIDELLNDPAIRPTIGGAGRLNSDALLDDRRNVCLISEGGGAIFAWRGPGVYEGHSFFRARGTEAITLGKAMLAQMATQASLIWGLTPLELRHVRWFNRKLGFTSLGLMQAPEGVGELFEMRF